MIMTMKFTCIGKGHGAPCLPAAKEDWEKLRREPWLAQMCARIEKGDDELKHRLPVWTPHCAEFKDNHRAIADAVKPLNRLMLDFDEKGHTSDILSKLKIGCAEPDLHGMEVLLVEESVRRGTHVLVELPEGMTAEEAQTLMREATGFEPDAAVKDVSRCIYMVPEDHTRYVNPRLFEVTSAAEPALVQTTPNPSYSGGEEKCFKGIPYSRIVAEWWQRNGGEPEEGERNVKLHKLAVNLRAICDNKKEVLMAVMPRFGLSDAELRSVIESACKEEPKGVSKTLASIIDDLALATEQDDDEEEDDFEADQTTPSPSYSGGEVPKAIYKGMPIGLKESLIGVPATMHIPVLCGVLPIAAAYADQVQIEYCDGNLQHLGLMSIIRGEQASNKSVVKNAVDVWKRQFDEEDALARKREEEWKERKKGRKANEKAPDDPKVLIRMVPVTVSCSTLLKRFKNANGHTLYSFGEELDTLRKTNGAGSWSSKYDIYRLSFDKGEWGQDYNSDAAESGVVKVAYNWTMLGTNGALRKCFKSDNIENGLSSRILVAEMPDSSFSKMPKFGKRSAEDEARIQEAVTRLRSYTGLVDTPRLRKAIEEWVEEKRVEAAKDIDHVKDTYRKRAAVIGFRCGVIFHLLETSPIPSCLGGEKGPSPQQGRLGRVSKACIDFAVMMAEYCLQQQIKVFGEALRNEYVKASDECQRYGANHSVFDRLAPTFSREDLGALKTDTSKSGLRNIIMRWKHDGWIVPIDRHHWSKTSHCPIVPSSH